MTDNRKEEARKVLNNRAGGVEERENAIHVLSQNPQPEDLVRLVRILEDDDFGMRWAAAVALSLAGDSALRPLLQALRARPDSVWLRQGAHHVFHYSSGSIARAYAREMMDAMKGPAAELTTEECAEHILQVLG
jgi:HEAT repeat protein